MCEKETAESFNISRDIKPTVLKHNNNNNDSVNRSVNIAVRYSLNNCANQNDSNNSIHRHYGGDSNSGPEDSPTFMPTPEMYASAFSQKAATGFFSHFHKNKDLTMLRQNRTDVFVVNNNNDFLRDKEITRPDSTAHHSDISVKTDHEDRKREHRCFQVSFI